MKLNVVKVPLQKGNRIFKPTLIFREIRFIVRAEFCDRLVYIIVICVYMYTNIYMFNVYKKYFSWQNLFTFISDSFTDIIFQFTAENKIHNSLLTPFSKIV